MVTKTEVEGTEGTVSVAGQVALAADEVVATSVVEEAEEDLAVTAEVVSFVVEEIEETLAVEEAEEALVVEEAEEVLAVEEAEEGGKIAEGSTDDLRVFSHSLGINFALPPLCNTNFWRRKEREMT